MLCAGGVHAIGAFAQGCFGPRCDMIVGPGNRYVTAAKALVAGPVHGPVKIDGIAGPSELLVLADGSADPEVIAADLIAQAEHDPAAGVWVATTETSAGPSIRDAVRRRVEALREPNRSTATTSLRRGGIFDVGDRDGLVAIADRIAAEHLEILTEDPDGISGRVRHAGGVFIGGGAGEVFGDYGIGPNHVLPTGGTARFTAGLSVLDFLRVRTWLRAVSATPKAAIVEEIATFARLEGLEGHAQAAEARLVSARIVPPAPVVAD
jgi:phosphoribosyl-ATP pyrophosphohydrolase/phosphoribosyl-AMP cyclohydrolase/histidinol dehydrogenase